MKIAFDPCYKYILPKGHRFPMEKYELLPEQLIYEGTITESAFFRPQALSHSQILSTHSSAYLEKLLKGEISASEQRKIGLPVSRKLVDRGMVISGGTYECIQHAFTDGVALNIAGGTHHAYPGHGEGFCVFNDFSLAANLALNENIVQKILIIDLDVHQGNGTAHIFENDDRVFTFSMHGERNYPAKKERSDLDIGLPDKTPDALYLSVLRNTLPKLIDRVEPDLIFYLAGVDILSGDKLGKLDVSIAGCLERDRFVFKTCRKNGIPVVVSMGGGYAEQLRTIIEAHANTFRAAADIYF